jgi:hypothetical protein
VTWTNTSSSATLFSLSQRLPAGVGPFAEIYHGPNTSFQYSFPTTGPNCDFEVSGVVAVVNGSATTEVSSAPSASITVARPAWQIAFQPAGGTFDTNDGNWKGNTLVQRINHGLLAQSGIKVRLTLLTASNGKMIWNRSQFRRRPSREWREIQPRTYGIRQMT